VPSCPKSWEPPVVAVNDLPVVNTAQPTRNAPHAFVPKMRVREADLLLPKVWASAAHHIRSLEGPSPSPATKAKGLPKSLGDWMRGAVDSK
jgi:hypothetical protein